MRLFGHPCAPQQYTSCLDAGNQTSFDFTEPDPTLVYYIAVQAYDAAGNLSAFSNEVHTSPVCRWP